MTVTAPANNATVTGSVNVTATAADNIGVAGVQFKLDGNNLGAEDTSSPYSISWNTTGATNGAHALTAVARDAAGNVKTATTVNVTVSNGGAGHDAADHQRDPVDEPHQRHRHHHLDDERGLRHPGRVRPHHRLRQLDDAGGRHGDGPLPGAQRV